MRLAGIAIICGVGLSAAAAPVLAAPAPAKDAAPVVAAAAKAMGIEGMSSIKQWGVGSSYGLGQNNNSSGPFPETGLNDYVRTIDFAAPVAKTTAVTYAAPVTGGPAVKADYVRGITAASPWPVQYEIWTTPWGFLKGAAANKATYDTAVVGGRPMKVVSWSPPVPKAPSGKAYRVVGYVGPTNLVERVDTWVDSPLYGDLRVETAFTDYRDLGGLMFPTTTTQKVDGQTSFEIQTLGVAANPGDLAKLVTLAPPTGGPPPPAAPRPPEKLAEGVWRIPGAYNAVAIEFKDYIVVFEPGPQNEARAQTILSETRRVIPGKPIRYGVITHHHSDHTGGLEAVVAEGITIVSPAVNKPYLTRAYSGPRTLLNDALAKSGKKPIIEAMGDKRVFDDGTHSLEIHVIKGLPHADGLVIGWLPKEKILIYADMFNLPTAADPVPNPPVVGTQVFVKNLERLKIEPERILSIHSLNPDRLATMDDIRKSLGMK